MRLMPKKLAYVSGPTWEKQLEQLKGLFDSSVIDKEWVIAKRLELSKGIASLEKGDTLIVTALFRLGLNPGGIVILMDDLEKRGIHFISLTDNIDTSDEDEGFGDFILDLAKVTQDLQIDQMKRMRGKRRPDSMTGGPKPKVANETIFLIVDLMNNKQESGMTDSEIGDACGVSRGRCQQIYSEFKKGLTLVQRKGKNKNQVIREREGKPDLTREEVAEELKRLSRRRS